MSGIKETLFSRFKVARETVGSDWRTKLAKQDDYFNSLEGARVMEQAASTGNGRPRIGIDRLVRITKALEEVAGIEHEVIV